MITLGYVKYVGQYIPLVFLKNSRLAAADCAFLLPSDGLFYIGLFMRYSFAFKRSVLIDLGGSDLPLGSAAGGMLTYNPVAWYIFKDQMGARLCLFSLQLQGRAAQSIEGLFRNARWLEREATDFFGFFFTNKSDRRSLFTLPLFYSAPFRRKYPAAGFYELFFCPLLRKLKFKHLSLQV